MKKIASIALRVIGGTIAILFFLLMVWLFLVATPDQFSAESELLREEIEAKQ